MIQYTIKTALNYEETSNHFERMSNIDPFIDHYSCNETGIPRRWKDYAKLKQLSNNGS